MQNNNFIVDYAHGELYNNILYFTLEKRESLEHLWKFRINKSKFNNDFDKFVKFCREVTKKTAIELNKLVDNKENLLRILQYTGNNPQKLEILAKIKKIVEKYAELGLFPLTKVVKYNPVPLKKDITGYAILATSTYSNQPHNNAEYEHPRVAMIQEENKEDKKIGWEMQPPKRKAPRKRQYTKKRGPSTNNKYFTIDTRGTIKEDEAMGTAFNADRNNSISELFKDL